MPPDVSQPDLALAAVLDGLNTSADVAAELGVPVKHASAVLCKLRRQGYLRWTGRVAPRADGVGGRAAKVYEVAR